MTAMVSKGGLSRSVAGRSPAGRSLRGPALLERLGALIALYLERYEQRRALAELDDRMLRDIGVDRAAQAHEARKPFWSA